MARDLPVGSLAKWSKLHAEANSKAIQDWVAQISVPILFQTRHNFQEGLAITGFEAQPLAPPDLACPPAWLRQVLKAKAKTSSYTSYCLWIFGRPTDPVQKSRMFDSLKNRMRNNKGSMALERDLHFP